jgi:hypothetical protein
MSNSNSKTPTNQPKRGPPTQAQLERMALTPCKNGDGCEHNQRRKCRYFHGGGAVAFEPKSHQRVPPAQSAPPPPPTQKDIIAKILKLNGFGRNSMGMLTSVDIDDAFKLELLRVLLNASASFMALKAMNDFSHNEDPNSSATSKYFTQVITIINSFTPFVKSGTKLGLAFEELRKLLMDSKYEIRNSQIGMCMTNFALPEGIEDILQAYESETASYAKAVKLSPLEVARKNPDQLPTDEFILFLGTIPNFSDFGMFKQMLATRSELRRNSSFKNSAFVGAYDAFEGLQEGNRLVQEKHAFQAEKEKNRKTVAEIVSDIKCLKGTSLDVSFKIMTANRKVFDAFVLNLSETDRNILLENFTSFMSVYSAYMAMSLSKDGTISVSSLNGAFASFLVKFKLDKNSRELDKKFFEFFRKPEFWSFWNLFNTMCPCPDDRDGNKTQIASSDVFKRFLKAIDGVFRTSVDDSEISDFENGLVKRGLVILLMVMMSPEMFSRLVSSGYVTKRYNAMNSDSFKSFLYWLTQTVVNRQYKKQAIQPDFEWSTLPRFFIKGSGQEAQAFSKEYLFEIIDETLCWFMSATNTGLNHVDVNLFLQENKLDWLFECTEDEDYGCMICVKDGQLPIEVIRVLTRCYALDDTYEGARQVAQLKSLLSLPPDQIRQMMKLLIEIQSSANKEEPFEALFKLLGLKIESKDHKDLAFSGLDEFVKILLEEIDSGVYSEALLMMSVFSYIQKNCGKSEHFMNMPSAIIFVLMKKKFSNLTHCEIANAIYCVRHGHTKGTVFLNTKLINQSISQLHDSSSMKVALQPFTITKTKESISATAPELEKCKKQIERFKMLFEEHCKPLSEFLKRAVPYMMNPHYMAELFQDSGEQVEVSASGQNPEDALNERLKASFMMYLKQSISQMSRQIFFDLSKKFEDIVKESSIPAKLLNFYKFARHMSAWINLVNAIFHNMGIQLRVSFQEIMKDLPDTKSREMTSLQKARLMTDHACKILQIPIPENWDDFDQHDQNSVLFWVVYQTLVTTYNIELPKTELRVEEKVILTIPIPELKVILETGSTLDELFSACLPYMESRLVRAFLLPVLNSHFTNGNKEKLDSLLCLLGNYESKFTIGDKTSFEDLFKYVASPCELSVSRRNEQYEQELFEQIKSSLSTDDDWTDADVVVAISDPILKPVKPLFKVTKKPQPQSDVDGCMASGGGPAVEKKVIYEEQRVGSSAEDHSAEEPVEASVVPSLDMSQLRSLLASDQKPSAIEYLRSVVFQDQEIREGLICMLDSDETTCASVIEALDEAGY